MGKKVTVDALVEGGKAVAGASMGSTLGPLGVNIGSVISKINEKTKDFKGMKVPVKVIVDSETKEFEITVGTPPATQLIKKEIGIEKGSGEHLRYKAGVIAIEQLIKVAKMKQDSLLANSLKASLKTMVGSCVSLGLLVDGKDPKQVLQEIDKGEYDKVIDSGQTEVPEEKQAQFEELKKEIEVKKKQIKKEKEAAKAAEEAKEAKKTKKIEAVIKKK